MKSGDDLSKMNRGYPRAVRLTRSGEFTSVRQKGRTYPGRYMILGVLKEAEPGGARVGVITSRRVGNAVVRNRVRRRLKELARLSRPQWQEAFWLVIVARHTASKASWQELEQEWQRLTRKAGILSLVRPAQPEEESAGESPCSSGS